MARAELDRVEAALEAELGPIESEPVPLEGGITNRNFRASFGGREVVFRVPGAETGELGIDRDAEALAARTAAELGIGPAVAAAIAEPRCLAADFIEGETMSAESLQDTEAIRGVAAILRALHDSGTTLPTRFDPFEVVRDHAERAEARGAEIPEAYAEADALAERIAAKLTGPLHQPVFTHNDLLPANLIRSSASSELRLIDWDYAGMGDRFFDLANFAINAELTLAGRDVLLEAYFEDAGDEHRSTLALMRVMSDFREAMWGVLQGVLSEIDFDFADYATKHFDRLLRTASEPEFQAALEAESVA